MPAESDAELKERQGDYATKVKALERLIQKLEENFFKKPFCPPPDYSYLFSVGTYPYTSWSTSNTGQNPVGSSVTLNGSLAALAVGIHSLSPIHAMVRSSEVEKAYKHWVTSTGIRKLPKIPEKQPEAGIYLDSDNLPWSPDPYMSIPVIWSGGICVQWLNWKVAKEIEQSFRSFFALRRAALFQFEKGTKSFREAALTSPDPIMKLAAQGKPPAYTAWRADDPLGEGWVSGNTKKPGGGGFGGLGLKGQASNDDGGGLIIAGAAALAAWYFLKR